MSCEKTPIEHGCMACHPCDSPAPLPGYAVGDQVRLLKNIWEGATDGLMPPQQLGRKGEILVVKGFGGLGPSSIKIAHASRTDDSYFVVFAEEVERA